MQTTFTEKVHQLVRQIPRGKTLSYKQVAEKIGHPNSARAVGTVLSKNYDPQIPCHRVLRSDGKPSGYNRGGYEQKLAILQQELSQ
jgi:methylated-DNA-[protein]-cysteine S-methyltransferase